MKKALVTYDFGMERMDLLRSLGYEVIYKKEKDIILDEEISDIEVLACYNPFNTLDISRLENLKWIQLLSVGVDQAPTNILNERNILLTNNKGGYSIPIGEWIVLKTLELYKHSYKLYTQQMNKKWHMDLSLLELCGKNITFIGTGSIASAAAKRFQGFEANILGINTTGNPTEYFHKCYAMDEMDEVLEQSDVVVITVPYTKKTHHLITRDRLKRMKKDAVLINIARGSIIKEIDLIEHLKEGNLMGAALDVFEKEPLPQDNPLWSMENVIVTAHNPWVSDMKDYRRFDILYKNMERYMKGQELFNIVNLSKGY